MCPWPLSRCVIILSAAPALSQMGGIMAAELLSPLLHTRSQPPCRHGPKASLVSGALPQSWRFAKLPRQSSEMAGIAKMTSETDSEPSSAELTGVLTAFSASRMRFSDSSVFDSRHSLRKTSTACKLSENLCRVLIKATTSERCRRLAFTRGLYKD